MGRDKAWLEIEGRPLLARVVELLARRCSPIVLSCRPGQQLPPLSDVQLWRVDDPVADAGPLPGLTAALERLAAAGVERAYLSSCDAAGLSERHIDWMLARLSASAGAIAAVPVERDGRRHPLAAALEVPGMLARAKALLAAGEARLQALVGPPHVVEVAVVELPDPEVLAPCNTPQQFTQLLARLAGRR